MGPSSPSQRVVLLAAVIVFAIAVALRMPSCYESFWLDELHSAWTIWGSLSEVGSRADVGHQSPPYFVALWFWKQFVGDSELGLRMSSVLATSLSCSVLTVSVTRWTGNLVAGVASGLILAIESNAIFYGTELRPYALVIFFASVVIACFLSLSTSRSRFERPVVWSILIGAVLFATLTQPTAIGVLLLFPLALLVRWTVRNPRELTRFGGIDAGWLLATAATGITVWRMTLGDSWQQRGLWAAFGSASRFDQIVDAWDWLWLLWIPLLVLAAATFAAHRSNRRKRIVELCLTVTTLALIGMAATGLYWLIAWSGWAPIWHRRYFVAVLPVFASLSGGAIGAVSGVATRHEAAGRQRFALSAVAAVLLVVGLGFRQRTIPLLAKYPVALAVRGEDWRAAVQWINEIASEKDQILLEAGLIESRLVSSPGSELAANHDQQPGRSVEISEPLASYLLFPVRGPYVVDHLVSPHTRPATTVPPQQPNQGQPNEGNRVSAARRQIIVVRRPAAQVRKNYDIGMGVVVPFGNITVIVTPSSPDLHP